MADPRSVAARLRLALDMHETGERLMRQKLKRARPMADDAEIEALVVAWLRERPGARAGDGAGRAVRWPRTRH